MLSELSLLIVDICFTILACMIFVSSGAIMVFFLFELLRSHK